VKIPALLATVYLTELRLILIQHVSVSTAASFPDDRPFHTHKKKEQILVNSL
jgi:hypothetical protein